MYNLLLFQVIYNTFDIKRYENTKREDKRRDIN